METNEMLKAILDSHNEDCQDIAERILSKSTTIAEERKHTGAFMSAVLDGNFEEAIRRADAINLTAIYKYMDKVGTATIAEFLLVKKRAEALGIILS